MPILTEEEIDKLMLSAENKSHGGWGLFIVGILLLLYIFYGVFINDSALVDDSPIIFFSSVILMGFGLAFIFLGDREKMNIFELLAIEEESLIKNQEKIEEKIEENAQEEKGVLIKAEVQNRRF